MANPEHLKILKQGVEQWNEWRRSHHNISPDLENADLRGAMLNGINFGEMLSGTWGGEALVATTNLGHACLESASLDQANLAGVDLSNANLRDANLRYSQLREANLDDANLEGAFLVGGNLCAARLRNTNFSRIWASATIFADLDLRTAKGLETVTHFGHSTVGIDTIYRSCGQIPETFLRGCGVPDDLIAYFGSIELYSCTISCSIDDRAFANRLQVDLQNEGVRCSIALHGFPDCRNPHEQTDLPIRVRDKLVLILSEHSMNRNWVKSEIAEARALEQQDKKQMLFPITLTPYEDVKRWKLFDADRGIDSAREVREYFIPDFSNWKDHDSYKAAFERLVADLKAGARD